MMSRQCLHFSFTNFSFTKTRVSISLSRLPVSQFLIHDDQGLHFSFTMCSVSISLSWCPVSPFLFHDHHGLHFFISRWQVFSCLYLTMSSVSFSISRWPGSPFLLYTMSNVSFPTFYNDQHFYYSTISRCTMSSFLYDQSVYSYILRYEVFLFLWPRSSFVYYFKTCIFLPICLQWINYILRCQMCPFLFFSFYDIQCHYTSTGIS